MKKLGKLKAVRFVLTLAMILGLSVSAMPAHAVTYITIGTASVGGMNYPLGIAMATIWNSNIEGMKAVAIATGGSVNNIDMLRTKDIEVAVCRAVEAYRAFHGIEKYPEPLPFLRSLTGGVMFDAKQIVARKDAKIESVADFKGKRIAVGPIGSGGEIDSREILKAYGLTFDDITPEYVEAGQAVDTMADGLIDGAILGLTPGSSAIAELMITGKVKLLSLSDEAFENLKEINPWIQRRKIPANLYTNQDYEVLTAGDPADLIICREDLPEDLAYKMTKVLYENHKVINSVAAALSQFGPDLVEPEANMMIPYHPGALKYFKEAGILE
jgi:TRAP transporter TAXI family solute receptor